MENLKFYMIEGCPYCEKVMTKLNDLNIEYDIYRAPRSKNKRHKVEEISGQRSVPVISDPNNNIVGMNESDDIVRYLEKEYGDNKEDNTEDSGSKRKISDVIYDIIDDLINLF